MHPNLKGFPSCHVVNLIDSPDRKVYMENEFAKLGITDYKIHSFPRIEKSDLVIKGDPEVLKVLPIGATSSHLLTIKWWYENTDEEMAAFFEDDCEFSQVDKWNFVFEDYIKMHGVLWDGLQLCVMHEGWAVMYPRYRVGWDHGLQCYILKRSYAKKIIDYYFEDDKTINFRMPYVPLQNFNKRNESHKLQTSIENTIYGLGWVHVHPLFNHNVIKFPSTVHDLNDKELAKIAIHSYEYVKEWWQKKGQHGTLDELFDYEWCCPSSTGQHFGSVLRFRQ